MLPSKLLFPMLFLTLTAFSFADTNNEEAIKKALEGINQIKVIKSSTPKVVSKVVGKAQIEAPQKAIKKKSLKKSIQKKHHKKHHKKHSKKRIDKTDFSKLKDVQTFGVVNQSKPYELGN